jgi:hypothetical protein
MKNDFVCQLNFRPFSWDIKIGDHIVKYGEPIGIATQDIRIGQHVYVYNL